MQHHKPQPHATIYHITIEGHLSTVWAKVFDGFILTHTNTGETILTGEVADQAALHGLLKKLRNYGMPLVSMERVSSVGDSFTNEEAHHQLKESNMQNNTQKNIVLVLGGTGKTGSRILERLNAMSVPTRSGSRRSSLRFDWNDSTTWAPVLENVRAVYVNYAPDLAVPSAPPAITAFTKLAVESGVEHLVLLSGRGEEEAQRCEEIIKAAGVDWTILRASWFSQNFSEGAFAPMVQGGMVALPAQPVPEPFVDVDDIADVAVAALTKDGHAGQLYELTGPRMLTFGDAIAEIAKATGRDVKFQQIPADVFDAELVKQGMPQDVVWLLNFLFSTVLDGRNAYLTDGVQRALGREPRDFTAFAQETAAKGIWN